ncbi:hypothetical protein BGX33_007177 [Mortierella sp. NVP41]|nr:hypothetical protein BGX33_007177 [Mortierella sp. NVP41]
MASIIIFALMAAALLGVMSAPVPHGDKVEIAGLNHKYSGYGFTDADYSPRGACSDLQYSSSDTVVAVSAAQFGNSKHGSSLCGKYVKVNRADNDSTHYIYKVIDVCKGCDKNSLLFSGRAFTNQDRPPIDWELIENADEDEDKDDDKPTDTSKPTPKPTSKPESNGHHSGRTYRGRGTWFSDTYGSCEVDFSQDEMIVALNEVQMGEQYGPKSHCFQKLRVSVKGDPLKSVIVRVVDTCPHRFCSYGQLDLSQAAFKKFAPMSQGILGLEWSFI